MNYSYAILDNAFLVHRPGKWNFTRHKEYYFERVQQQIAIYKLRDELREKYGSKTGCVI